MDVSEDPCGGGSAWAAGLLNALHCEATLGLWAMGSQGLGV